MSVNYWTLRSADEGKGVLTEKLAHRVDRYANYANIGVKLVLKNSLQLSNRSIFFQFYNL